MFYYSWSDILNALCCAKPECVDKERLLYCLEVRRDYEEVTLDKLYDLGVITIDEYIKYMKKVVEFEEEKLKYIKSRIVEAEKEKDKFNPLLYYGFAGFGEI